MSGPLEGSSVVVTGGGAGVGRGIALACAAADAAVVVASRHDDGTSVVAEIEARGGSAAWVRCDVTRAETVDEAITVASRLTGRLAAVVHNATSARSSEPARLEDVDAALLAEHASVSLDGAFHCARAGYDALRAAHGTFLVMTSPSGMEGSATLPVYGMVKAALRGFTKSLAREWATSGITVNAISPLAQSPAMVNAIREDPALEARLAARVPLGRLGDPEADIGPAVVFLASSGARYITGQTLVVDGGRFMTL